MICILHGYLLDGSGSNLWTRSVVRALCQQGRTVHLVCQEPHPERYDFVSEAYDWAPDGTATETLRRSAALPGRCIVHRPRLGSTLPVYVWDEYEEFDDVVPMIDLDDAALEDYLHRNVVAVTRIVRDHGITAMHVNHAVLMSVVAQRVHAWTGVPYAVMPHGSALEYAVRRDERLRRHAAEALAHASKIFVIGDEIAQRLQATLGNAAPALDARLVHLDLGVDTSAFRPIARTHRRRNIEQVTHLLRDVPRGRTHAQQQRLRDRLAAGEDAAAILAEADDYVAKQPDEDVEAKLSTVDWHGDRVAAFVGRLIAAKGVHALIAALPLALERQPALRLLVVGHGPLREPLEAMVHALEHGERTVYRRILESMLAQDAAQPHYHAPLQAFHDALERDGREDAYWTAAQTHVRADRVRFCGYLTHREMAWLLPCCDAAVFPSLVKEAGPLVFLEALASGVFPVGTNMGGMATKIDVVAPQLEPRDARALALQPDNDRIVDELVRALPEAVALGERYRAVLRAVAEAHYDWRPVARRLGEQLDRLPG